MPITTRKGSKIPALLSIAQQKAAKAERERKRKMAEVLAGLRRQREFIYSKVARIKSSLQKADDEQVPVDEFILETHLRTIDAAYQEMNDCQNKMCTADPTKQEEEEQHYVDFEALFTEVRAVVCRLITTYKRQNEARFNTALQVTPGVSPSFRVQQSVLPHTPLPSFDGKSEHWFRFKSMFLDIMNKCPTEDAATKLYHLDRCLVGEATGVINQQFINENNFEAAWNFLVQRYEDKRKIVDIHANKLLQLKPMTQESGKQLRDLIEECQRHVDSLRYHGYEVLGLSDIVLVNILASKLDFETKKLWEASNKHGVVPNYVDTIAFLEKHSLVLERVEASSISQQKVKPKAQIAPPKAQQTTKSSSFPVTNAEAKCVFCEKEHLNHQCEEFLQLSPSERNTRAKKAGVCYNCLRKGHMTAKCSSKYSCRECNKRHHTVLHLDLPKPSDDTCKNETTRSEGDNASTSTSNVVTLNCTTGTSRYKEVLLSTAVVNVLDVHGHSKLCRVLLDSGSQLHLVTEAMTTLLGIQRNKCTTSVIGVNGRESQIKHQVTVMFQSRTSSYRKDIECLVVPRITGILPAQQLNTSDLEIPGDICLADPDFHKPQRIDLLIGAELFFSILKDSRIDLGNGRPILQETFLGWVVAGPIYNRSSYVQPQHCYTVSLDSDCQLETLVQRFWALEDVPTASRLSPEEELCEKHYAQTTTRDSSGRYVVRLPFRDNISKLGETKQYALHRFYQLEKRLNNNVELKREYDAFIEEYIRLNHCREIFEPEISSTLNYFLPHHAVLKPTSSTTKLRTVFDASAKSTTGVSLNDILMTGPVVQDPLLDITIRFRIHQYVFSCDVPKMYRQIRMFGADTRFLRAFYRKRSTDPVRTFELTTVTYGTASAPFAATRTLKQLVQDEGAQFPIAAEIVLHDFYIDDALTGGESVDEIKEASKQLIQLLQCGGFQLHKWCSNSMEFLETIPEELREKRTSLELSGANDVIKTLGLLWNPSTDELLFRMNPFQEQAIITKRHILSEVAKTFDPLGLFAPSVVLCKLLIRDLWRLKIGWDEEVPQEQISSWKRYQASLKRAEGMKISRCVLSPRRVSVELHAFSDASFMAYGACVYLRSVLSDGSAELHLLASKSRVSPKQTIPRLELCGFLLMSRLVSVVMSALKLQFENVVLWADSTVVLCWLNKSPHELNTFVSNRVAEIQRSTGGFDRKYVASKSNPADMLSRGVYPEELKKSEFWWHGPTFLQKASYGAFEEAELVEIPDMKKSTFAVSEEPGELPVLTKFSSFRRLRRVMAFVARFIRKTRKIRTDSDHHLFPTVEEYRVSLNMIVKAIQLKHFPEEMKQIDRFQQTGDAKHKYVGKLRYLNPIMEQGVLRVGGRIKHANLTFNQRHPVILPSKHHVTKIIIDDIHQTYLHIGPSGLLSILRQRFWILDGRNIVQQHLRKCVRCFKANPPKLERFMGDLPAYRVTQADVFSRVGVDYAGPFLIKTGNPRKPTIVKGYIALFVCLASKAIHMELAVDLSSQAFINVLKRFVSRRGVPTMIMSDNGTNFIGANSELNQLYKLFQKESTKQDINEYCLPLEIKWKFIPARSPEFGGVWEAGVKSAKRHIKRVVGESKYTHDQWNTLIAQIEAILNSRPLVPMSADPSDLKVISPGHLLIGRELTMIPEPSLEGLKMSTLSRYQVMQKMRDDFWKRWSSDYLQELQRRPKHNRLHKELKVGDLVVLREDNLPPLQWRLARVVQTHPGSDGVTRVVTVRTSSGTFKRTTAKLALLPNED